MINNLIQKLSSETDLSIEDFKKKYAFALDYLNFTGIKSLDDFQDIDLEQSIKEFLECGDFNLNMVTNQHSILMAPRAALMLLCGFYNMTFDDLPNNIKIKFNNYSNYLDEIWDKIYK